jgi:hypothetical protein
MPAVTAAAEMLTNAAEREIAWVFLARIATLQAIPGTPFACSTPIAKTRIGESGS